MALVFGSTEFDADPGYNLVSLTGTAAEVRATLADGTGISAGCKFRGRKEDIILEGGDGANAVIIYKVEKP